ncbi:hypothetical protein [Flavobacterium sp. N2820]|uniref:hypothetical protein n=1 Tax=Flavobacterium sp. N2820 TaxID=2986834 RepID=UPI002223FD48|nr:hypothetical protein [Flavobacterium sp. N2820]
MNLSGNWQDFYEYGSGYELPYFGQRVHIKASITDVNGSFTGEIVEDGSVFSVKLEATIKGFIEDGFISFVKKYPKKPIIVEHSTTINYESGSLEIEHEGIVDAQNNSIYGNWFIIEIITDELGTFENTSQGIWLLTKL